VTPALHRLRDALVVVTVAALGNPLHELGHWIGYTLSGIPAGISFQHTYYLDHWAPSFAGALGGPLLSLVLSWIGVAVLSWTRFVTLGAALAIVMAYSRLLPYLLFGVLAPSQLPFNDEGVLAIWLGWPIWSWLVIFTPLFVASIAVTWSRLASGTARRIALFATILVVYGIAAAFEVGVLDPIFFPGVGRRELVQVAPLP